jgi:hypothetical protein
MKWMRGTHGWGIVAMLLACGVMQQARGAETGLTDEQIVQSLKRGTDYLLAHKKGDNWETGAKYTLNGQHGGETCLALLTLLHVGESLQDDPIYGPKLNPNGKELAPVIAWVTRLEAEETYTAALQASALALLPKIEEKTTARAGQGTASPAPSRHAALQRAYRYLVSAMGISGGYTYGPPGTGKGATFQDRWTKYYQLKTTSRDQKAIDKARGDLDNLVRQLRRSFGGPEFEAQRCMEDLRDIARKPGREGQAAQAEMQELTRYASAMPPAPPIDFAGAIAKDKEAYDDLARRQQTGDMAGLKFPIDELPQHLAESKRIYERSISDANNRFAPIGDLSNSQYGALGMWALADAGFEIKREYWQVTDRFWRLLQKPDGSWSYSADRYVADNTSFEAMTVAGLATLHITQEFVDRAVRTQPKPDKNIEAGLAWLNEHFKPDTGNMYYMYGIERVGLATGRKFLGTHDWFREGGADIIRRQKKDGSWDGNYVAATPIPSTCFPLLFLSRGRNPIAFNKLQYAGAWNARPQDDAFLTRWLSKRYERALNWQIVNLDVDPDQWRDAPILLITGANDPKFTDQDVDKLRKFVESGGLIFSTADDGSARFTEAMKKYAGEIVHQKYEMRQLPKTHMLFSRDLGADVTTVPPMWALSNGVRELWVHSAGDMAASWQGQKLANREHFEVPSALLFYATGKSGLNNRFVALQQAEEGPVHKTVTLARLMAGPNPDPEPGAWPALAAKLRRRGIDLEIQNVPLGELDASKEKVAHWTGTGRVTLTPEETAALKKFLQSGGMLLAEAAGGNSEFTESFLRLMKSMFPEAGPEALAADHAVFTGKFAEGKPLGEVRFRKFGTLALGKGVTAAAVDGIQVGGKVRVLFSQWDYSSGLLGTNTWGIVGYAPETADGLASNLVLWASEQ